MASKEYATLPPKKKKHFLAFFLRNIWKNEESVQLFPSYEKHQEKMKKINRTLLLCSSGIQKVSLFVQFSLFKISHPLSEILYQLLLDGFFMTHVDTTITYGTAVLYSLLNYVFNV